MLDDNVMHDDGILRVSVMMLDEQQRAIAANRTTRSAEVTDAFGQPAGHRPGYCFAPRSDQSEVDKAWDEQSAFLRDAWKSPSHAHEPSAPDFAAPAKSPGGGAGGGDTLAQRIPAGVGAEALFKARDEAWLEHGEWLREAWQHA